MKFPYRLLLIPTVLAGSFFLTGETTHTKPNNIIEVERPIDLSSNRGESRTPIGTLPNTTILPTTTTTTSTSTTTSTIKPTTTTKKLIPKTTTTIARKKEVPQSTARQTNDGRKWMNLINQYPWDTERAYRIMMCESGGNPNAINASSGATGLFQIHPGGQRYKDPAVNVATAYAKFQARGWKPWVCHG